MNTALLPDLVITKIHSASTFYSPENKSSHRTDRPHWALIMKYEGESFYTAKGKRFLSDANHLVLLPKGCSYDWRCTKAGHYFTLEFDCAATGDEPLCFSLNSSEKLLTMLRELERRRNLRHPFYEMESLRDAYAILLHLAKGSTEPYLPKHRQEKLLPALEYVSQHYNTHLTNDTLARISGMSTVYFRKLFTRIMGESPMAYVKRFRIEKAKEMLRSDYGSLTDLAATLGYSALYDFSRDFKKHTGVPPSKY